jgi:hypothetical protein
MINKEELCKQIRMIFPDIGTCGIDLDADYDGAQQRWTVTLHKEGKTLKTFLSPGDAELCMMGKECVSLAIEVNQLVDSIERMPGKVAASPKTQSAESEGQICTKAPEFAEHYRMTDDDPPCDDGRKGRG